MPRIPVLEPQELPQELRALHEELVRVTSNPRNEVVRGFGHRPEVIAGFLRFFIPLRSGGLLGSRLKELLRLRVAALTGCWG